jgi:hypothetical protein
VAGSPGNHEVTPTYTEADLKDGRCVGSVTNPSFNEPLAACRNNYGYGYLQGTNKTHLHWTWKYTGFGTPSCDAPPCQIPDASKWPDSVFHDELWLVKDAGSHGPRDYEAPGRLHPTAAFTPYAPEGHQTNFKYWYESSRDEWVHDGCGEWPSDGDTSDGCDNPTTTCDIIGNVRACTDSPLW